MTETAPKTAGLRPKLEPTYVRSELVEREAELAAVETLLQDTAGRRVLVIEGPPGIGKTSLLREARTLGLDAGAQVLGARGMELERAFSFGVVRQLLEPLVVQLGEDERAALLTGAAELAGPVFEPAQLTNEPGASATMAILHGLYWLTANVAAEQRLLLVIDDLHWCDLPSLRWLGYLLPRLDGLDLYVVLALRSTEPGADPALLGQILADPLVTVIRPSSLSLKATLQLVRDALSAEVDDGFGLACHELTGGNPLLLHELLATLVAERSEDNALTVAGLDDLAACAGRRAVAARLAHLPPGATSLAKAVAILGDEADLYQGAVLAGLDEQDASQAAVDLARVDVLRPEAPLGFVHPLIRSAVEETLTPHERAAGHARAAQLLDESGADRDRVAAHLLLVPPTLVPTEVGSRVVPILRDAARRASCRGAPESAVAYLNRALAESSSPVERSDLVLELGLEEALTNAPAAAEHLQEAYDTVADLETRGDVAVALGQSLVFSGRAEQGAALAKTALAELPPELSEQRAALEAFELYAIFFGVHSTDCADMTRRLAKHRTLSPGAGLGAKMLGAVAAIDWAYRGGAASDCVALARAALEGGELITGTHRPSQTVARSRSGRVSSLPAFPAIFVLTLADADEALETWDLALATGHRRGSLFLVSSIHLWRGFASLLRGDLLEAKSELEAAGQGYELYGYSRFANAYLSAFLASTLLASGDVGAARGALDEFTDPGTTADGVRFWLHSRAELLLAEDRIEEALEIADEIGRRNPQMVNPVVGQWRSIRMQALLRLGRQEEARTAAAENLELARRWGTPRAVGAALRTAGLVEGGPAGLALLEESVELLAKSPAKLEYATSEAELGAALRRANRRAQAREHLRRAVELATICGAAPLAARAETELLATGARPRRIALSGVDSLTPSERRVAEMAAKGPTNREIAQTLFVTPRTVEVHLSSVYRKLGISARSQLRTALARPTH